MKQLLSQPFGGDGGTITVTSDGGNLNVVVSYPLAKLLGPVKADVVDKLKTLLPGTWEAPLIDAAWDAIVAAIGS